LAPWREPFAWLALALLATVMAGVPLTWRADAMVVLAVYVAFAAGQRAALRQLARRAPDQRPTRSRPER